MPDDRLQTRTIKVPVAEVQSGGTKSEFYRDLRAMLQRCAAAMNRCLIECAKVDADAMAAVAAGEPVPKLDQSYKNLGKRLYDSIKTSFPGQSNIAATITRAANEKYCAERFQILIGRRSLPTQRSWPMPLLHNKSTRMVKFRLDHDGNVLASFKLGETCYVVRLRGGSNYARQLRTIKAAIESEAIGDSKVWIDRRGVAVFGIACRIPPQDREGLSGTLRVHTSRDAFIVATKQQNDTPFVINADHVKRWQAERMRIQQRLRQDRKSGTVRAKLVNRQRIVSQKYFNRLDSFTHEAAAPIAEHARRRRVSTVEYDGTIKSYYGPQFPWYEFEQKLEDKCQLIGIQFVKVTQEMKPAEQDEPHVYFDLGVDRATGQLRNVKIGKTTRASGKRAKDDARATDQEWVTLATHATSKSGLAKLEKHYLAMFAAHKINGEMFRREPVIEWLREAGCLGNTGNLSQIQQYMEA